MSPLQLALTAVALVIVGLALAAAWVVTRRGADRIADRLAVAWPARRTPPEAGSWAVHPLPVARTRPVGPISIPAVVIIDVGADQ